MFLNIIYYKIELKIIIYYIVYSDRMVERKINKAIDTYVKTFKEQIKLKCDELGIKNEGLVQYVFDYDRLVINKEEFSKRKRVKNVVPDFDRCIAKRANNEQCTRKKKGGCEYCGTHMKGIPHGIIESTGEPKKTITKIEVWVQDIAGIIYYIDKHLNVYQTEDIIAEKENPKVIATYSCIAGENYIIHWPG